MTNATQRHLRLRLFHIQPRCAYCQTPLRKRSATIDHQVPRSRGGPDTDENLILCCKSCNAAKRDRTLREWIDDLIDAAESAGVVV